MIYSIPLTMTEYDYDKQEGCHKIPESKKLGS